MAEHSGVTAAVVVSAVFVSYKQALCAHKAIPMNGLGGRMVVFQAVFQGAGLWPGWNRVLARFGLILEQGLPVVCPDLGIGFGGNCVLVWNTAGRQAYPQRVDGCRRGAGAWPGCAQAAVQAGGRRGAASWAKARGDTKRTRTQDTAAALTAPCAQRFIMTADRAVAQAGRAIRHRQEDRHRRAHTCGNYGARGVDGGLSVTRAVVHAGAVDKDTAVVARVPVVVKAQARTPLWCRCCRWCRLRRAPRLRQAHMHRRVAGVSARCRWRGAAACAGCWCSRLMCASGGVGAHGVVGAGGGCRSWPGYRRRGWSVAPLWGWWCRRWR